MDINYGIAFWGGIISVLSPCVFPLLPSIFAQMVAFNNRGNTLYLIINTFNFILGFTLVFVFLGAKVTLFGRILYSFLPVLRRVGGMLIIVMGLNMTGLINLNFIPQRGGVYKGPKGILGSFFMGVILASGWLPCVGPILTSILILSTNSTTVSKGIMYLLVYSMGFAVPIFIFMVLFGKFINLNKLNKFLPIIHKISGILLIIIGILVFFDYLSWISIWLGGIF